MGGNQRISRRAKLEKLAKDGIDVAINFVLEERGDVFLKGKVENRGGYWLVGYNVQLPLKDVRFNGTYTSLTVNVPKNGQVERQLKREGYLD